MKPVTIDEIVDMLLGAYLLMDGSYWLEAHEYETMAGRIKQHGIAPPEGYCIVPIDTLKHWLNIGDLNPKDLAPRIEAYIKDNP